MADVILCGHIVGIRYTETSAIVSLTERKQGYKKKDGTIVDDELLTYLVYFKAYFRNYISSHFNKGALVKIYATLLPYMKDHDGKTIDGFTLIGKTIDLAPYPSNTLRMEHKMIKDSLLHSVGTPNVDSYMQDDF